MISDSVKQVQGFAGALVNAYRVLDQRCYVLAPLIRNEAVKEALGKKVQGKGVAAFNRLVPWFGQDIVRDTVRVFLDDDTRTASFRNIVRKASHPPVYKALREHFRTIPDRWHKDDTVIEGLTAEQTAQFVAKWKERDRVSIRGFFRQGLGGGRGSSQGA